MIKEQNSAITMFLKWILFLCFIRKIGQLVQQMQATAYAVTVTE